MKYSTQIEKFSASAHTFTSATSSSASEVSQIQSDTDGMACAPIGMSLAQISGWVQPPAGANSNQETPNGIEESNEKAQEGQETLEHEDAVDSELWLELGNSACRQLPGQDGISIARDGWRWHSVSRSLFRSHLPAIPPAGRAGRQIRFRHIQPAPIAAFVSPLSTPAVISREMVNYHFKGSLALPSPAISPGGLALG